MDAHEYLEKVAKEKKREIDLSPYVQDVGMLAGMGVAPSATRAAGKRFLHALDKDIPGGTAKSLFGIPTPDEEKKFAKHIEKIKKQNPGVKVSIGEVPWGVMKKDLGLLGKIPALVDYAYNNQGQSPQYSPSANTIYMAHLRSPAVLEHEAGHAAGGLGKKILQSRITKGLAGAVGMGTYLKAQNLSKKKKNKTEDYTAEERDKRLKSARNYSLVSGASIAAPTLLEEARATGRAYLNTPKADRKKLMKVLSPAYGTYAGKLLPTAIGGGLAIEAYRRLIKPKSKTKKMSKVAAIHETLERRILMISRNDNALEAIRTLVEIDKTAGVRENIKALALGALMGTPIGLGAVGAHHYSPAVKKVVADIGKKVTGKKPIGSDVQRIKTPKPWTYIPNYPAQSSPQTPFSIHNRHIQAAEGSMKRKKK